MSRRNKITNIVSQSKGYAEQYLKQAQGYNRNMPKVFSGFLSAHINEFIHLYQYSNNRLIGCVILHENNVKALENTINQALKQIDLGKLAIKEEEADDGNPTESE